MGVRAAARGSGAGSLITYLLGISDVDPIRYGLLMERFLSPLRHQLPDIDLDVESARRTEVYEQVLSRYGGERCTCVSMMDTYRARHGIRDVGAALGLPPGEVDALAKAFPHIRASQVRAAMRDLPELRASGLARGENAGRTDLLLRLVERLDGLPRHVALHPCGVLLSDATLLDRTPVESSWLGFPMSQFDKDDVEALGLLKLDVLGIRMQSAMAYAVQQVEKVSGEVVDVDAIPRDDERTFALVQSTKTLGCFQIESPGQRELVGKFAPETFEDLIIDISLFRPGPVKSDMVRPFLEGRQGWRAVEHVHPALAPHLAQTWGVVVFHEQVLQIVSTMTGCTLAEADEVRRALGDPQGQPEVRVWFVPAALARGYEIQVVEKVWEVLKAFGSFGFCKAHAAAFALPTYQSAWLKAHHTAAFLAGVLTHDPGMYPKRLILDDARQFGIAVLSLDVNLSEAGYTVEKVGVLDEPPPRILDQVDSVLDEAALRAGSRSDAHPDPPEPSRRPRRRPRPRRPEPRRLPSPPLRRTQPPRRPPPRSAHRRSRSARRPRPRHPDRAGRGQGHQRGRGHPDRRRAPLRQPVRLLAPRRRQPARGGAAGGRGGVRQPVRPRLARPRAAAGAGHPPRPAAAGRRARPVEQVGAGVRAGGRGGSRPAGRRRAVRAS